ncbi:hypothetical protein AV654_12370 [Paenibacillus elgii]|uniref:Uncharacterized protein n=1 Tax=Paenibacillus elgii TaxID=189691 RepID=A0A165RB10_9BACL|nr:hypothetical protein [Paenibacillus elgii]KZE80302.1 hypothetical protein AV654_12370 [Paenibacillus elgii]
MSSGKTSNLKLHNWTGSDQVLRSEFNENFEKIDAFASELMAMGSIPVQLNYGMQTVNVEHTRMLENVSMKGRTLVNLLGRDGNCEDASRWGQYTSAMLSLDFVKKASGSNSIQFKIVSGQHSAGIVKPYTVSAGKYYIAIADVANTDIQNGVVLNFGRNKTAEYTGTSFATKWVKLAPSESGQQLLSIFGFGTPGQTANVDNVRLYEISAEDYANIDRMTSEEIVAKWPYIDGMKSVYSPYVIKYGENLLPPFTEWNVMAGNGGTPKLDIDDPFSASLIADLSGQAIYVDLPVAPNTTYTLALASLPANGFIGVNSFDENMQFVSAYEGYTSKVSKTVTTEPNVRYLRVMLGNHTFGAGTYRFMKPMLSLGSTAKPFKSRNDDHLFFPNVSLTSNTDGTIHDTLYQRDGKYWKQARFRTMELDGKLDWSLVDGVYTGFKEVKVPIMEEDVTNTAVLVKHDGKLLKVNPDGTKPSGGDEFTLTTGSKHLFISISNSDSGWGDSYKPTPEDIKAYFNGWRMYQEDTSAATGIYVSGKKWWARRNGTGFDSATAEIVPTAYGFINGPTPYKLQYQLAAPTVEEIIAEGGITFHEELNQVEVGNGMIVREHHNVVTIGGNSYMLMGAGQKYRADRAFAVYKNGVNAGWSLKRRVSFDVNYGWGYAQTLSSNVDPSATYTVTYLAFDQHALTCNVQSIQGEYAGNLKSVVDTLAANQADMSEQITELQGGTNAARQAFEEHTLRKDNPHDVTPAQIGAETPDGAQNKVDAHANSTSGAHGATSAAVAGKIIQRDAAGRAKVAAPVAADDIARKQETDAAQSRANASLPKDGSEPMTGRLVVPAGPSGGLHFPNDAFGGSGDTASITLRQKSGEDQELTIEVQNDPADTINLKTPHRDGVYVNGHRAWHAGNVTPLDLNAGGTLNNSVGFGTGHGLHFDSFGTNFIASGGGDSATYSSHNIRIRGHYGLGMETHDGSVNGVYDFRAGQWTTKNGFVVDNGGEKFRVNWNGDIIQRGTVMAPTRVNNGVFEFWNGGGWQSVGGVKYVQHGETNVPTEGTVTVQISPVNVTKTFVNFPNTGGTTTTVFTNGWVKLLNSDHIQIHAAMGGTYQWQVVEYY